MRSPWLHRERVLSTLTASRSASNRPKVQSLPRKASGEGERTHPLGDTQRARRAGERRGKPVVLGAEGVALVRRSAGRVLFGCHEPREARPQRGAGRLLAPRRNDFEQG